jgi:hypothetical protein
MAEDLKYGHVTLEHGDVGEDEPVIVFRARDVALPALLDFYHTLCRALGSPQRHLDLVETRRHDILAWQEANGSRVPTSESSRGWMP